MNSSWKLVLIVASAAASLVAIVSSQTIEDHDKIVSCYVGTWAFYR